MPVPTDQEDWLHGWTPPMRTLERGSGIVVLAETASGSRLSLKAPRPAIDRFPERIAYWLEAKAAVLPDIELESPASFFYVVVSPRLQPDGAIHVTEFGRGTAPAAPENWTARPSRALLSAAIQKLRAPAMPVGSRRTRDNGASST